MLGSRLDHGVDNLDSMATIAARARSLTMGPGGSLILQGGPYIYRKYGDGGSLYLRGSPYLRDTGPTDRAKTTPLLRYDGPD